MYATVRFVGFVSSVVVAVAQTIATPGAKAEGTDSGERAAATIPYFSDAGQAYARTHRLPPPPFKEGI